MDGSVKDYSRFACDGTFLPDAQPHVLVDLGFADTERFRSSYETLDEVLADSDGAEGVTLVLRSKARGEGDSSRRVEEIVRWAPCSPQGV